MAEGGWVRSGNRKKNKKKERYKWAKMVENDGRVDGRWQARKLDGKRRWGLALN